MFEGEGRIGRRGYGFALVALGAVAVAAATGLFHGPRLLPALAFGLLALVAVGRTAVGKVAPSGDRRRVRADAAGLHVDGVLTVPRERVRRVHFERTPDGAPAVHLHLRPRPASLVVAVDHQDQAEALVEALALDEEPLARFCAQPPWARHLRALGIFLTTSPWVLFNVLRFIPMWGLAILVLLYVVVALPVVLPQRVEVGHDGVFLRWLGNRRFLPFRAIEEARSTPIGVELLVSGRPVEIRLTYRDGGADADRDALLARIREGIEAHGAAARADEEALLAQGTRSREDWLAAMGALGAGEGGYRAASIPRERLWAILESPSADPSAREGAALALHASLDEGERGRMAAAARKTASPRLRVALDGVAQAPDEAKLRVAVEAAERETEEPVSENLTARKA